MRLWQISRTSTMWPLSRCVLRLTITPLLWQLENVKEYTRHEHCRIGLPHYCSRPM